MPRKRNEVGGEPADHEESLVPVIEEEERRLAALLDEARANAEEMVRTAESAAQGRAEEMRSRIPKMKEEKRRQAVVLFEKEADELRKETSGAAGRLREAIEAGTRDAVSAIESIVWPARG